MNRDIEWRFFCFVFACFDSLARTRSTLLNVIFFKFEYVRLLSDVDYIRLHLQIMKIFHVFSFEFWRRTLCRIYSFFFSMGDVRGSLVDAYSIFLLYFFCNRLAVCRSIIVCIINYQIRVFVNAGFTWRRSRANSKKNAARQRQSAFIFVRFLFWIRRWMRYELLYQCSAFKRSNRGIKSLARCRFVLRRKPSSRSLFDTKYFSHSLQNFTAVRNSMHCTGGVCLRELRF